MSGEQSPERETPTTPERAEPSGLRLYVASLSDHNDGLLHGAWIDLDGDHDEMWKQVYEMLARSPTARRTGMLAEEWAIHDHEGFNGLTVGEYENLDQLSTIAGHVIQHGQQFLAWAALVGITEASADEADDHFEDSYWGQYDSAEEFGETLVEATGFNLDEMPGIPEPFRPYISIDIDGLVRDMQLGGEIDITKADHGIYVFFTS